MMLEQIEFVGQLKMGDTVRIGSPRSDHDEVDGPLYEVEGIEVLEGMHPYQQLVRADLVDETGNESRLEQEIEDSQPIHSIPSLGGAAVTVWVERE
jgi:hypothetical protein